MSRYKLVIEYDGTEFSGFQWQIGVRTVQSELELALEKLNMGQIRIDGAGRTDSGVHAIGQVISFSAECPIPTEKLAVSLNSVLPNDISVRRAQLVDDDFHARFSAKSRTYVYLILNQTQRSAMFGRYTYHCPFSLDLQSMKSAGSQLLGVQDFASWANSSTEVATTIRDITRLDIARRGAFILVRIEASAFLRGMVRNIVGTLVEVGSGKRAASDIRRITEARDRAAAGHSAPARGLCLVKVRY